MRPALMLLLIPAGLQGQAVEEDMSAQLSKVRRVYIDLLSGNTAAIKIRDLLMASVQSSKLFIITEDASKADATLKGAAEESVFTENFSSSDGLVAHSQVGLPGSGSTGTRSGRGGIGLSIGEHESVRTQERKHEAIATVRLVAKDGDVIWSTTQESMGGKFLGAAADVADKVAKKLIADIRRARGQIPAGSPPGTTK